MKRLILTLGCVVALVIAFIYAKDNNFFRKVKEKPVPLITFDIQQSVSVGIKTNKTDIVLTRTSKDQPWTFDQPKGIPASSDAVNYWLSDYVRLENIGKVSDTDQDLATFGLLRPVGSFYVALSDGTKHTLLLGDELPTSTEMYAKWAEQPGIFKIGPKDAHRLDKSVFDLSDKAPVHLKFERVTNASLSWRGISWTIQKTKDAKSVFDTKWKVNDQTNVEYVVAAEIIGKVAFLSTAESLIPIDQYEPKTAPDLSFMLTQANADGSEKDVKSYTGYSDGEGNTILHEKDGAFWYKIKDYAIKDAANQPFQGMTE